MATTAASSTVTLTGASGTNYQFTLYPWGTVFKPVCAVYAMLKLATDGTYYVQYVGQTGDCSERFDFHHKESCFRSHGVTHIGLLIENSEQRRFAIETDLVRAYNPPCNG